MNCVCPNCGDDIDMGDLPVTEEEFPFNCPHCGELIKSAEYGDFQEVKWSL